MEPLSSHETQSHFGSLPSSQTPPNSPSKDERAIRVFIYALFAAILTVGYWTFEIWKNRSVLLGDTADYERTPDWTIETPSQPFANAFIRTQDTTFWSQRSTGALTTDSTIATQAAAITAVNTVTKARLTIAPHSIVTLNRKHVEVISGFALLASSTSHETSVLLPSSQSAASLEPKIGSTHDLNLNERVTFSWPKSIQDPDLFLEFAREPSFHTVLFTQPADAATSASTSFADRSPGAWFVRLRTKEKALGYTAFNLVESQTPDQLRRLGKRWLAWRDRALAVSYRIEFSNDESFKTTAHSFQVRNREFDLSRISAGRYFARVTSIAVDGRETTSRPLAIQVLDKNEILRAGLELGDPDLKLFARGYRIVLDKNEVSRIREGYVILRESELRGVKVADEIFKGIAKNDYVKRSEILKGVIFELSRDESFSNPERVRPDAQGELLPPALPLGILYARLRKIESDGTLGAYGPPSRLTTYTPPPLPQPSPKILDPNAVEVELKWSFDISVAGFEIRMSPDRDFKDETTTTLQTRGTAKPVPTEPLKNFFWTVTALNEFGQRVSMPSEIQEVKQFKPPERKLRAANVTSAPREPAIARPLAPVLKSPLEDAIVIGGATAKKYGKLKWEFDTSTGFEVQIATDGDFVNIIERAKIDKSEYTLQGDLPEGALFWRVRKLKTKQWSDSRRFELVYE